MKRSTHEHKEQQANPRPIQRYLNCQQQRQTDRETGEQVPHPPEIPVCVERAASSTALGPAACLGGAASARTTDVAHRLRPTNVTHVAGLRLAGFTHDQIKTAGFHTSSHHKQQVLHQIKSRPSSFIPDQISTIRFHARPVHNQQVSHTIKTKPTGFIQSDPDQQVSHVIRSTGFKLDQIKTNGLTND